VLDLVAKQVDGKIASMAMTTKRTLNVRETIGAARERAGLGR
jgi:hypothetical protein